MKKTTAQRNGQGSREDRVAVYLSMPSDGDGPATPEGTGSRGAAAGTGNGTGRRRLGELLLAEGVVTPDQLNRALEIHRATGQRLGQVLLDMGVVDQERLARLLGQQIGAEVIRLVGAALREDGLTLLPQQMASRVQAIPIAPPHSVLTVALVDPPAIIALHGNRR